jgi:hypothetical protein
MKNTYLWAIIAGVLMFSGHAWADISHVQASLVADTTGVAVGKPFTVGVLLKIDPGWHIYWKNPGDAGLPTKVKWTLPDGFTAGELRYPTPHQFTLPGNIICYGYENTVLLMADITPGGSVGNGVPGSQADIGAQVSWLVCADVCIPGKTTVDLKLPIEAGEKANADLFDVWEKQEPADGSRSPDVASWTVHRTGGDATAGFNYELDVQWTGDVPEHIDFLPGGLAGYALENVNVARADKKAQVTFRLRPLAGDKNLAPTMDAELGYNQGSDWRGVSFSFSIAQI